MWCRLFIFTFLVALGAMQLVGCASPTTSPTPPPMVVAADAYTRAFEAAGEVLRDARFEIDRQDHRFGQIVTRPRLAPTIVEVWNGDNPTLTQAAESTVNAQRRVVRVTLTPATDASALAATPAGGGSADYEMHVEVLIERYQDPRQRLTGAADGFQVFGWLDQTPTELRRRGIDGPYWQPAGRDPVTEKELLDAINAKLEPAASAVPS